MSGGKNEGAGRPDFLRHVADRSGKLHPVRKPKLLRLPDQLPAFLPVPVDDQRSVREFRRNPGEGAQDQRMVFIGVHPSHRHDSPVRPFRPSFPDKRGIQGIFQNHRLLPDHGRKKVPGRAGLDDHPRRAGKEGLRQKTHGKVIVFAFRLSPHGNHSGNPGKAGAQKRHEIIFSDKGKDAVRRKFHKNPAQLPVSGQKISDPAARFLLGRDLA